MQIVYWRLCAFFFCCSAFEHVFSKCTSSWTSLESQVRFSWQFLVIFLLHFSKFWLTSKRRVGFAISVAMVTVMCAWLFALSPVLLHNKRKKRPRSYDEVCDENKYTYFGCLRCFFWENRFRVICVVRNDFLTQIELFLCAKFCVFVWTYAKFN